MDRKEYIAGLSYASVTTEATLNNSRDDLDQLAAHVVMDALTVLRKQIDAGAEPWAEYA